MYLQIKKSIVTLLVRLTVELLSSRYILELE
jgi:hypothetical protein